MNAEQKQGIGGRDCLYINRGDRMIAVYPRQQMNPPEIGIAVVKGVKDRAITFTVEDFKSVVEWLKSWDYI